MSTEKYVISRLFKQSTNEYIIYYSDNTIEINGVCTQSKNIPQKIDVDKYSDISVKQIIKLIDETKLETDNLLQPLYLPCLFQTHLIILTDLFNIKSKILSTSDLLSNAIYICADQFDYNYFKNILNLRVIDDPRKIIGDEYYIDINPVNYRQFNTIFTTVPVDRPPLTTYFIFNIFEINVLPDDNDSDVFINDISLIKPDFNRIVFKTNFDISAENTFKIILLMIHQNPIKINLRLYYFISNLLNRFREYRAITVNGINCGITNKIESTITNKSGFIIYSA